MRVIGTPLARRLLARVRIRESPCWDVYAAKIYHGAPRLLQHLITQAKHTEGCHLPSLRERLNRIDDRP